MFPFFNVKAEKTTPKAVIAANTEKIAKSKSILSIDQNESSGLG